MVARACGLDVHKSTIVATVSGTGLRKETREFSTFTSSFIDLRTWLQSIGITHVAMESTCTAIARNIICVSRFSRTGAISDSFLCKRLYRLA